MNINDFNIKKENQVKAINKIIQLSKENHFEASVKEAILKAGQKAIEAINTERAEVYKELENFEFDPGVYDHNHPGNAVDIKTNVKDVRSMVNEIGNILATLRAENKEIYTGVIINHNTNDKFSFTEKFKQAASKFDYSLSIINDSLGSANPPEEGVSALKDDSNIDFGEKEIPSTETHILTEEDIKENPELTEAGLKAGDEVHLNAEIGEKPSETTPPPTEEKPATQKSTKKDSKK